MGYADENALTGQYSSGFYGIPEAEYARSMGAGRGRNPDSIPAFSSTQPEIL